MSYLANSHFTIGYRNMADSVFKKVFKFDEVKETAQKAFPRAVVLGVVFAAVFVCGKIIHGEDRLPVLSDFFGGGHLFLIFLLLSVLFSAINFGVMYITDFYRIHRREFLPEIMTRWWFGMLLIAVIYLLIYLAYYPGVWSYDIPEQNRMVLGLEPLSAHHPPLHTFLWWFCMQIEKITRGLFKAIFVYSFHQIFASAAVYTYVAVTIRETTENDSAYLATLIFYAFHPVAGLFSFSITKDSVFALVFTLLITTIWRCLYKHRRQFWKYVPAIFGLALLACFLRNNMIYSLILFCIPALKFEEEKRKRFLLVFGCIALCILYFFIHGVFFSVAGIEKGKSREMLSIPIQQVARVCAVHNGTVSNAARYNSYAAGASDPKPLTTEQKKEISKYVDPGNAALFYNPRISDPVKELMTEETEKDTGGFLKLWIKLGFQYPKEYAIAFLSQTNPYWYAYSRNKDPYLNDQYIEDGIFEDENYPLERLNWVKPVYAVYHAIADGKGDRIPVLSWLLCRGVPFWVSLAGIIICINNKRKKEVFIGLMMLCYILPLFFGPVCNIRYIFPVMMQYPLLVIAMFGKERRTGFLLHTLLRAFGNIKKNF